MHGVLRFTYQTSMRSLGHTLHDDDPFEFNTVCMIFMVGVDTCTRDRLY